MPRSGHVAALREFVGPRLLVLPAVTLCIADEDGRIMLVRHDDGNVWAPPGGAIEPGETPADAAVREAWEELGMVVEPTDLIGVYGGPGHEIRYDNGDRVTYVMTVFRCEVITGGPRPDRVEVHEHRYVDEQEWSDVRVAAWVPLVLPEVFAWLGTTEADARFTPAAWQPGSRPR